MTVDSSATTGIPASRASVISAAINKSLLHHMPDAAQARMCDAAKEIAVRRTAVAGPVDKHRAADDQLARDKAPIAAVLAVIAAVAHDKEAVRRHLHRLACHAEFVALTRQVLAGFNGIHGAFGIINVVFLIRLPLLKFSCLERRLIIIRVADHAMLGQKLAVDKDLVVLE